MKNSEQKLKVLFIITKSNWGGAQKYVYELATNIDKKYFVPIVALGGNGLLAEKLRDAHIQVINLPSLERDINPFRDFSAFRDLIRTMRNEHPDAVHLNSSKIGSLGSIAARIAGIPRIIFTAHGWAFNEDRPIIARLFIKLAAFMTIALSDITIAVSDAVAKKAPAWGMRKKVIVIHLPISKEKTILEKRSAREHFLAKNSKLHDDSRAWVGIVAELHKNKGISYAIEAMHDSDIQKKVVLIIVGSGQEYTALENQIRASDLDASVILSGFEPDAARYMPAFDMFLLPSITEAFGYVLLEAGFAVLPVVASRVGGIPEIIENEKTGLLVSPRSSDTIRNAMQRIVDSPSLATRLAVALHAKVLGEFSTDSVVAQTAELYKK